MAAKKPDDKTLQGLPDFAKAKDSYTALPGTPTTAEAMAPEASQGAWRERAFVPRGVLSKDEVLSGLEGSLKQVLGTANHATVAFREVREAWLPLLRQAVEQVGGDGLDAWLLRLLKPPGRRAVDPLVDDLSSAMGSLRETRDLGTFEKAALEVVEVVRSALSLKKPRKLSFKELERALEGKLDVEVLLGVLLSDTAELQRRRDEVEKAMAQFRGQAKGAPGAGAQGLYSNFTRLKHELKLLQAAAPSTSVDPEQTT